MKSPLGPQPGSGSARAPIASVIIPAFQAEAFLRDSIQSALAQTCRDIEVIVVDDGSTDGTWDIALACSREDPRVVPMRQPRQMGPAAARNAAIERATGKWIAMLDADDLFLPDRLERMIAAAEACGADLLADNLLEVEYGTGRHLGYCFPDLKEAQVGPITLVEATRHDMPDQPRRSKFGLLQPVIRREFLVGHDLRYAEDLKVGEDFFLYFQAIAQGGRFFRVPQAYYVYRIRGSSASFDHSATLYLSAANRRMLHIAEELGDRELVALLHRRQRLIDFSSFAFLTGRGKFGAALRYVHWSSPALILRQARVAAGAARRHLLADILPRRRSQPQDPAPSHPRPEPPPNGQPRKVEQESPARHRLA